MNKKNKALTAMLTLGLTSGLTGAPVFAEGQNPNSGSSGIVTTKTSTLENDGTYTIDISAYATGETVTTEVTTVKPCDIVLVIDQSGSMDGRVEKLQEAVNLFLTNVKNNSDDHRVAIAGYASNGSDESGSAWRNTGLFIDGQLKKYGSSSDNNSTQLTTRDYQNSLVSVAGEDGNVNSKLTDAVKNFKSEGATRSSYGLTMAKNVFDNNRDDSRNKITVLFTDGDPGYSGFNGDQSNQSITEANSTLAIANDIKNYTNSETGVKSEIFTVGLFSDSTPGDKTVKYMNGVSSNYQGVTSLDDFNSSTETVYEIVESTSLNTGSTYYIKNGSGYRTITYSSNNKSWGYFTMEWSGSIPSWKWNVVDTNTTDIYERKTVAYPGAQAVSDKYYKLASSVDDLKNIFDRISNSVTNPTTSVKLDETAVLKDIISDEFELPEGAEVTATLQVGTVSVVGEEPKWSDPVSVDENEISKSVDGKTVEVTGFSYKDNYIAPKHPGKKLNLTIKGVVPSESTVQNGSYATNDPVSGIYSNGEQAVKLPVPTVAATSKAYVVDYAKPIDMSSEDWKQIDVKNVKETPNKLTLAKDASVMSFGNVNVNNGAASVRYTPKTMQWNGIDSFYSFGTTTETEINGSGVGQAADGNKYLWSKVSVVPANSIYYEDTFTTTESGTVGIAFGPNWTKPENVNQNTYATETEHGKWTTTDAANSDGTVTKGEFKNDQMATATFRFSGTGFDIYSQTNSQAGTASVVVRKAGENKIVKLSTIDTVSHSGTYYNVPTLSIMNLPYGDYDVELKVTGGAKHEGRTEFLLDGIRIYNPVNDKLAVEDTYKGEYNAQFHTLRNWTSTGTGFVDSVLNEDGTRNPSAGDYNDAEISKIAPNNELYLAQNHSITISQPENVNGLGNPDKYYIGLKSLDGTPVQVNLTDGTVAKTVTVHSTVDMYYPVVPNEEGAITVANVSEDGERNLVSVTKLRTAHTVKPKTAEGASLDDEIVVQAVDNEVAVRSAMRLMSYAPVENFDEGTAEDGFEQEPEDLTIGTENNDVEETELPSEEVTVDNGEDEVVKSGQTNWFNKLFAGFSGLFRR